MQLFIRLYLITKYRKWRMHNEYHTLHTPLFHFNFETQNCPKLLSANSYCILFINIQDSAKLPFLHYSRLPHFH